MRTLVALMVLMAVAAACAAVMAQNTPYDEPTAIMAVRYAGASYCQAKVIESWSCPSCKNLPHTNATVVYAAPTDTQAFVGYDSTNNRIWIVFRGTNPLSIQDWLDDLTFTQTNPYLQCTSCGVHEGFYDSWLGLRDGVVSATNGFLAANPAATIHITGHSLGAAMAQLAAVDLALDMGWNSTTVYSFGEPRVGNPQWVPFYNSVIGSGSYRLVHYADPVPHVPLEIMGFHHHAREVFYSESQDSYKVCDGSGEDPSCSDGLLIPVWVPDHLNYIGFDFTGNYLACALDAEEREAAIKKLRHEQRLQREEYERETRESRHPRRGLPPASVVVEEEIDEEVEFLAP